MLEAVIKAVITVLIPIFIRWIRTRYPSTYSKNRNKDFEALMPILENEITSFNRMIVEHRFSEFLKFRLRFPEIEAILLSASPLYLFRKYKRVSMFVDFNEQKNVLVIPINILLRNQGRILKW